MNTVRKMVSLLLVCTLLCAAFPTHVYAAKVTKNGFTFDSSLYTVQWKNATSYKVYSDLNGELGKLTYTVGVARRNGTNDYTLLVKMVMTPNNNEVSIRNNHGTREKGYGFSEYVSVSTVVPGPLGDYRPVNSPGTDSIELNLGYSDSSASIGVSYSVVHNDLDITAKCNTPERTFYIVYDYKPNVNPLYNNKYLANESSQYGMAQFENTSRQQTFRLNFDARFGAALDNEASPLGIYWNWVWQGTAQVDYTFTL